MSRRGPYFGGPGVVPLESLLFPEVCVVRTATFVGTDTTVNYYIPYLDMFHAVAGETTLTINGVPKIYGTDYQHITQQDSTLSIGIGFALAILLAGGESVVFTWKERRILVEPPTVSLCRTIVGGGGDYELDTAQMWKASDINSAPNGFRVPPGPPGYTAEIWRLTRRTGGLSKTGRQNGGKRFLPYRRGPQALMPDAWIFNSDFYHAYNIKLWRQFKVCYFNLSTGARSGLSTVSIVSGGTRPDQHNGYGPFRYRAWLR